jgi:pimeloyl-ACP methyl ester carboxylesterase
MGHFIHTNTIMTGSKALVLRDDDPPVRAAREAEAALFAHYGIAAAARFVALPAYGIRVRVLEIAPLKDATAAAASAVAAPAVAAPAVAETGPLVIVPGNTGDGFVFAPLLPSLRERCPGRRIIIINRPGGGLSDGMDHRAVELRRFAVDTITAVFDALGIGRAPMIAHSMGSHWSLWFALERPGRAASLSLLGVPGNVLDTCAPPALRLASVRGLNRLFLPLLVPKAQGKAFRGLSIMGHSQKTCAKLPAALAGCYYRFQNLPHYGVSSLSLMEMTNRLRGSRPGVRITAEELGTITAPVQLIWGGRDPFGKLATGRRIAGTLPRGEFRLIDGGGHLPWLDDPAQCGALIAAFLAQNP